ncbi:SprT-like domain-containing protein Spartan [Aphelenchoides fujianensis]|nr:SprT-like domain-containing protein Spartan [Aphelenchoides fujianensis]
MSEPLLKLRPRSDFVENHEMIHGYRFLTARNTDREGHGPEFQAHMHRINRIAGTNISIYHSFHDEVRLYKTHCKFPFPAYIYSLNVQGGAATARAARAPRTSRTMNRAPGPTDFWFDSHQRACGGTFVKVKEPEKVEKAAKPEKTATPKPKGVVKKKEKPPVGPSIRPFLVPAPSSSKGRPVELIDVTENERPSTSFAGVFIGQSRRLCD